MPLCSSSVYPDIRSAIANRVATYLGADAGRLLAVFYLWLMSPILHVEESQLRPIDRIGEIRAPLFLLSGAADRYTTLAEARSLFDRATAPKQFWAVAGAAHLDLAAYAPEAYRQRMLEFLETQLRRPAATPN